MRKFYLIIWTFLLSMAIPTFAAENGNFTLIFHADHPKRVKIVDPTSPYYAKEYLEFGEDGSLSVEVAPSNVYIDIDAASGYLISSVKNEEGISFNQESELPSTSFRFRFGDYEYGEGYYFKDGITDGMHIYLTTQTRPSAVYTFKGVPEQIDGIYYDGESFTANAEGIWEITVFEGSETIRIDAADGYRIRSVKEGVSGDEAKISDKTKAYIYCTELDGDRTYEIVTYPIDEDRTASFTLNIKSGSASDVSLRFYGTYTDLPLADTESQVIKFDPETENAFNVSHTDYYSSLYKVVLDGEQLYESYGSFYVAPNDGSVLDVYAAFPEVAVPVKFTFTNEGTEGFIRSVEVNNEPLSDGAWLTEDFSVMMGDDLYIRFNTDTYDWDSIVVNGRELYSAYYNEKITEEAYEFKITASKIGTDKVTVKCPAWEAVSLEGYNTLDWTLTGEATEIEIPTNESRIKVVAEQGYIVHDVYDEATGESLYDGRYFSGWTDGMTIVIDAEEFVRDQTLMVYLEDADWYYSRFYLGNSTPLETKVDVEPGYNKVMFGDGDFNDGFFQFMPDYYSDGVVYLNNEKLEWAGYNLLGADQIQDGDVLKVYTEEQDTHFIKYDIAEDVNVAVRHDHIVAVENPGEHDLLPGTIIHIQPKARETESPIEVKVDDETLSPDENGIFTVIADGDKNIKVMKANGTGIEAIDANSNIAGDVYDTLGTLVLRNASANDIKKLPAGIYIIGKKKVVVK